VPVTRARWLAALAGVAILSYALGAAPYQQHSGTSRVRIDMEVSTGRGIYVFLNDLARRPTTLPVEPAVRKVYEFEVPRENLSLLRIDPTDVAGATVRIYGVEVAAEGRTIARFTPQDLRVWSISGLTLVDDPAAFAVISSNDDPMLVSFQRVEVTAEHGVVLALNRLLRNRPVSLPLLLLPLLLLAGLLERRAVMPVVLLLLVWVVVPWILHEVQAWHVRRPAIDVAVSRAAFLGESVRLNQLAGMATFAAGLCLACGAAVLRWRRGGVMLTQLERHGGPGSGRLLTLWMCVLAVLLAPDLSSTLASMARLVYVPHWDNDILTYWAAAVTRGHLPYRDFWYPYAGQFLFELRWPIGPLVRWAFDVLLFGSLTAGLWRLAPQRRLGMVAVVMLVLIADRMGLVFTLNRYLLAPVVVIACLAAMRSRELDRGVIALVTMAVTLAMIFDPMQLVTGIVAMALVWLLEHRLYWVANWPAAKVALRLPALLATSGVSVAIVVGGLMTWSGQLAPALDFFVNVGDTVSYAAFPTPLNNPAWRLFDVQLGVIWWPIAALTVGLYERLAAPDDESALRGAALLALGVAGFLVEQKHLVRPMEYQLVIYPLLGGLVYVVLTPGRLRWATTLTVSGLVGVLLALLSVQNRTADVANLAVGAPRRLAGAVGVMLDGNQSRRANIERFTSERFERYANEREIVTTLDAQAPGPLTLFSLTDAPALYALAGQVVWIADMYGASPVAEQRRTIEWLRRARPEYVVFQSGQLEFDSVPLAIRVPEILAEVVSTYVPDRRIGRYEVLRRRTPHEGIPLDYWQRQLGPSLEMGFIPAAIDVSGRAPCERGPSCDVYLIADVGRVQTVGKRSVTFAFGQQTVRVQFDVDLDSGSYVVPVSRLWFWSAASAGNAPVVLSSSDPGLKTHWVKLARDADRLY